MSTKTNQNQPIKKQWETPFLEILARDEINAKNDPYFHEGTIVVTQPNFNGHGQFGHKAGNPGFWAYKATLIS